MSILNNISNHYLLFLQIYTTLEKCIIASKEKQFKLLKEQHESQVGGATKSIHAQVSREFQSLNKRHKDKDELDRWRILQSFFIRIYLYNWSFYM